jgi:hypothetical protein
MAYMFPTAPAGKAGQGVSASGSRGGQSGIMHGVLLGSNGFSVHPVRPRNSEDTSSSCIRTQITVFFFGIYPVFHVLQSQAGQGQPGSRQQTQSENSSEGNRGVA